MQKDFQSFIDSQDKEMEAFVDAIDNLMRWREAKGTEVEPLEGRWFFGMGYFMQNMLNCLNDTLCRAALANLWRGYSDSELYTATRLTSTCSPFMETLA